VNEIGPTIAESVWTYLRDPENRREIDRLQAEIRLEAPAAGESEKRPLEGKSFVLTGTLSEPRPRVRARIEEAGGTVTSSVSSRTDYVVAGEKAGSKRQQAEELGVPILDEAALHRLLEDETE
jgi:DNA ligase (NAD+)